MNIILVISKDQNIITVKKKGKRLVKVEQSNYESQNQHQRL